MQLLFLMYPLYVSLKVRLFSWGRRAYSLEYFVHKHGKSCIDLVQSVIYVGLVIKLHKTIENKNGVGFLLSR